MDLIDEKFTGTPFYGVPKMTASIQIQDHPVNRNNANYVQG